MLICVGRCRVLIDVGAIPGTAVSLSQILLKGSKGEHLYLTVNLDSVADLSLLLYGQIEGDWETIL